MNTSKSRAVLGAAGFTFIEILVVLVLLAVMTTMAVPSMSSYVDRTNTRRALDQLVADLAYSRVLAVQQGTRVSVSIFEDGSYTVSSLDESGDWNLLKTVQLGTEFPGVSISGGLTNLEFSSRGLLITSGSTEGFVKIQRNGARDSVFVSPAGRVYRAF